MRSPDSLTLREKLSDADRLNREIMDHLERAFVPQSHELRRVTRVSGEEDMTSQLADVTLRNQVDNLLKHDDYTQKMTDNLKAYLTSIGHEVGKIVGG